MKTKTTFKIFLPHEYEKEAAYLTSMAAKGWLFCGGRAPIYKFTQTQPQEIQFQLDFIAIKEYSDSYQQLFEDAGWKLVHKMPYRNGCWYYFCKKTSATTEKIYTDVASKLVLLNRVIKNYTLGLAFPLLLLLNSLITLFNNNTLKAYTLFYFLQIPFILLIFLVIIFILYSLWGMQALKKKLEKEKDDLNK